MTAIFALYEHILKTVHPAEASQHSGLLLKDGQMVKQVSLENFKNELDESSSEQTFAKVLGILETKHVLWMLKILPPALLRRLRRELPQTSPST